MVLGGFHLGSPLEDRIAPTVRYFEELSPRPTYVLPMHCTGFAAKVALANALGEQVVLPAGVGHKIVIE